MLLTYFDISIFSNNNLFNIVKTSYSIFLLQQEYIYFNKRFFYVYVYTLYQKIIYIILIIHLVLYFSRETFDCDYINFVFLNNVEYVYLDSVQEVALYLCKYCNYWQLQNKYTFWWMERFILLSIDCSMVLSLPLYEIYFLMENLHTTSCRIKRN